MGDVGEISVQKIIFRSLSLSLHCPHYSPSMRISYDTHKYRRRSHRANYSLPKVKYFQVLYCAATACLILLAAPPRARAFLLLPLGKSAEYHQGSSEAISVRRLRGTRGLPSRRRRRSCCTGGEDCFELSAAAAPAAPVFSAERVSWGCYYETCSIHTELWAADCGAVCPSMCICVGYLAKDGNGAASVRFAQATIILL